MYDSKLTRLFAWLTRCWVRDSS